VPREQALLTVWGRQKLDNKQSLLARHSEKMENKFSIFLALG